MFTYRKYALYAHTRLRPSIPFVLALAGSAAALTAYVFTRGLPRKTGPRSDAPTPTPQLQVSLCCRLRKLCPHPRRRAARTRGGGACDDVAVRFNKSMSLCDLCVCVCVSLCPQWCSYVECTVSECNDAACKQAARKCVYASMMMMMRCV